LAASPTDRRPNPYAEQERFINNLTYVYQRQQEEPLPADTFRLLRTAVTDLERADPDRHYRIMALAFIMWAVYAELQGAEPDIPAYLQKAEKLLTGKTHPEDLKLLGAVFNHLGSYYSTRKEDLGMLRDLVSEEGEERLNKTFAQYAGKASLIALSLYEKTGNKNYLEKALAEALRKAKLQYCEHAPAIYSHPKYWANIIALSDPRPIYP
jgi:hypothetical protein